MQCQQHPPRLEDHQTVSCHKLMHQDPNAGPRAFNTVRSAQKSRSQAVAKSMIVIVRLPRIVAIIAGNSRERSHVNLSTILFASCRPPCTTILSESK